jgi:hypothetical protein
MSLAKPQNNYLKYLTLKKDINNLFTKKSNKMKKILKKIKIKFSKFQMWCNSLWTAHYKINIGWRNKTNLTKGKVIDNKNLKKIKENIK